MVVDSACTVGFWAAPTHRQSPCTSPFCTCSRVRPRCPHRLRPAAPRPSLSWRSWEVRTSPYIIRRSPVLHIELRERRSSHTVGLVVEYSPATGETRVRFPDGVPSDPFSSSLEAVKLLPPHSTYLFCPLLNASFCHILAHLMGQKPVAESHIHITKCPPSSPEPSVCVECLFVRVIRHRGPSRMEPLYYRWLSVT